MAVSSASSTRCRKNDACGCSPLRPSGSFIRRCGPSVYNDLAVSFHQVVHPVLSEEAGVANLQHLLGGPDERSSECPAHAAQSSRTGAAGGGRETDGDGRRSCVW